MDDSAELPPTLYHYCSASTFHSIMKHRSIWMSSLSLSNDTMEGRLVSKLIDERARASGLSEARLQVIQMGVGGLERMFDGLGFCVSETGDLLSQWRGYADDAHGFSIGFSSVYFSRLAAKEDSLFLRKVAYDRTSHMAIIGPTYERMHQSVLSGVLDPVHPGSLLTEVKSDADIAAALRERAPALLEYMTHIFELIKELYVLKGSAFAEEREWRLISVTPNIVSDGHQIFDKQFRVAGRKIVPYRDLKMPDSDEPPITEIVLGPKNPTPREVVEQYVRSCGLTASVRASSATYR